MSALATIDPAMFVALPGTWFWLILLIVLLALMMMKRKSRKAKIDRAA